MGVPPFMETPIYSIYFNVFHINSMGLLHMNGWFLQQLSTVVVEDSHRFRRDQVGLLEGTSLHPIPFHPPRIDRPVEHNFLLFTNCGGITRLNQPSYFGKRAQWNPSYFLWCVNVPSLWLLTGPNPSLAPCRMAWFFRRCCQTMSCQPCRFSEVYPLGLNMS